MPFNATDGSCTATGALYQNTWATYNVQNQLTSTNVSGSPINPGYDAEGGTFDDGVHLYLYDAEGRVCAENGPSGAFAYLYDAAGNRVGKGAINNWTCDITQNGFQSNGFTTYGYIVGPSGEQLTEMQWLNNGWNQWNHTNVYAGGKLIGTYDTAGLHFYFDDPLGTRRAQANSSGVLEAVYQSLPFGDGYTSSGTVSDPTENHFTGKERDTESGNDYFLARYYNSATGRFLSPDWSASVGPIPYAKLGDPQSLNLYAYVENRPISQADPGGHEGCTLEGMATSCNGLDNNEAAVADQSASEASANRMLDAQEAQDRASEEWAAGQFGPDYSWKNQGRDTDYVSISYWPKSAGGFGHVGIGVDTDDTQGYSTANPKVHWWERLFGAPDGAPEDDLKAHTSSSGEVAPHSYLHIPISAAQAQAMRAAMENRVENGGHYNLIFNNCAQFVESVLHAGGVSGVPHAEVFGPAILGGILRLEHRSPFRRHERRASEVGGNA